MDRSTLTVNCPDCAHPIAHDEFVDWGAQTMFKTAVCAECGTTITYPTSADGQLETSRPAVGRGVHGTTREARLSEVLLSRPTLEQKE